MSERISNQFALEIGCFIANLGIDGSKMKIDKNKLIIKDCKLGEIKEKLENSEIDYKEIRGGHDKDSNKIVIIEFY